MHALTRQLLFLICAIGVANGVDAKSDSYTGRQIVAVLDEFNNQGARFAYSSNLVTDDLRVMSEPTATTPLEIVREILRPYRLAVREEGDLHLIVRMTKAEIQALAPRIDIDAHAPPPRPVLETVTVSASRYQLSRDMTNAKYYFDQRDIQNLPDVGDDPVRSVQRLPGAASGGFSSKVHMRGGEESETGIMLNGHRLLDPFHVRDYQSIFSSVDSRAINGIEVFTGGFPVAYGDRLSGLILIDALNPDRPKRTELGVSVYNTSLLSGGVSNDGDVQWLGSIRRGNLDLILNEKLGEPSYYDAFGQISVNLTPNAQLSVNGLFADDRVLVVLESEPDEREQSKSDTRNVQTWVRLDNQWSDELQSTTILSFSSLENSRNAFTSDEEKFVSSVRDRRDIEEIVFRQDWTWDASDRHRIHWGLEFERAEAEYDYASDVTYFELSEIIAGTDETQIRNSVVTPEADSFSLYIADKWRIHERTILEYGLRWDTQTFTTDTSDSQLSPRISLVHALNSGTDIRASWGRYHQSQRIDELQVEDGVTRFWPAQKADHVIVGWHQRLDDRYALRVEAFHKSMDRLRPRYENLFDPFALIPELAPDRIEIAPTHASASGLEISLRYDGPQGLDWWASYSLSKSQDKIDGRYELRSWDQRHALIAGLSWSSENWEAAVIASVHSGWPKTPLALIETIDEDGELEFEPSIGPRNSDRYPFFATIDARVSRAFDVGRGTLTAFLEVSNITNRRNVCCSDYDLEEDENGNEFLAFSEDYWLPIVPAIGVLWEF